MAQGGLLLHPLPNPLVVHNVVCPDQAGQVEGLRGGVEGHGAIPGILRDRLERDVLVPAQDDVRPDLVGNHKNVVFAIQLHDPLQLPSLPHPAAGIVGRAEDCRVNVLLHNFPLHVLKVHAPDTGLVLHQGGVDNIVTVISQALGKADVGG